MQTFETTALYFSPTGGSKAGVLSIANALAQPVSAVDITIRATTAPSLRLSEKDVLVIGAPVYGGRIYHGVWDRLANLHGEHTPCVVTVTYGNRHYDDALLELSDFVSSRGFVPIAAAALIGEHTYGAIQQGRPSTDDLEQDRAFAAKVLDKLHADDNRPAQIPGTRPYKEGPQCGVGGRFRPLTNEACVHCGLCAKQCPEQAIDFSDAGKIDSDKCISCFRCIKKCPVHAKNMNAPAYSAFAEAFTQQLSHRRENEFYL